MLSDDDDDEDTASAASVEPLGMEVDNVADRASASAAGETSPSEHKTSRDSEYSIFLR